VPREAASRADVATCAVAPLAFLICNLISAIAHRSVRRHRRCGQHGCSRSRWTGSDVAHFEGARRAAGGFRIGLHFEAIRLLTVGDPVSSRSVPDAKASVAAPLIEIGEGADV
jgi:hypothetical protein